MLVAHLLIALFSALLIAFIASFAFGTKGPWGSFLWFFLVVFLFAWAGGIWLMPFGPRWHGIVWLPIIFMGILGTLLLAAASPRTYRKRIVVEEKTMTNFERILVVDAFFWVVIIFLLMFGVSHYMVN